MKGNQKKCTGLYEQRHFEDDLVKLKLLNGLCGGSICHSYCQLTRYQLFACVIN